MMKIIVGIDEAGRGCWAGPLVAAAVAFTRPIIGLNDSKKLTKLQREKLFQEITDSAVYGIGWVYPKEIDQNGLTWATSKAMREALNQITIKFDEIIIDGNLNYLPEQSNVTVLPKADALIAEVSAASILAKVSRDRYMTEVAPKYPHYQFEKHVGYGTALHHEMLKLYGVSDLHRLSYKPLKLLLREASV